MHRFRTEVARGSEEDRFEAAVYRYLELYEASSSDALIAMHSEPRGETVIKTVTLWSADAARHFGLYWQSFAATNVSAASQPVSALHDRRPHSQGSL